jgi:hypothetical protein
MKPRVRATIATVDETTATRRDTIEAFVQKSKRKHAVGIRQSFLQRGRGALAGAATLSWFVRRKDALGLDLFLLLLLRGRGARYGGHFINIQSGTWTRALGRDSKSASQQLSRALRRLEDHHLVKRVKTRKGVRVELRKEDGSATKYSPPGGGPNDTYFQLPLAYWLDDEYMTLSLPGKATLMIALGEQPEFELPVAQAPRFYGISPETAARGFDELVRAGLALYEVRTVKDPMAPLGKRSVKFWRLQPPYERALATAPEAPARLRRVK